MRFEVTTDIDIPKAMKKIVNNEFWMFATSEWYRLISPYTPRDTGMLYQNVTIRPKEITYNAPYAKEVYTTNKRYRKDKNPMAVCYWDKKAIPTQGPKLIEAMQLSLIHI